MNLSEIESRIAARDTARLNAAIARTARREQKTAEANRRTARYAEASAIVATGKCPCCGAAIRRNNSLTGWYQCSQFGAVGFRADANKPSCDWQTFTE